MKESQLERRCRAYINKTYEGGTFEKIVNKSRVGWPDRTIIIPGDPALIGFCELKKPGGRVTMPQFMMIVELQDKGVWAFWANDFDDFVQEVEARAPRRP